MAAIALWDNHISRRIGHHHLTYDQRCQISALLQAGNCPAQIARKLDVARSTISRELKRNTGKHGYRHKQAHKKAVARRKKASSVPRKINFALIELIERLLRQEQWSPDQISGFLARSKIFVSHEWIYRHIWADKKKGGDLWTYTRNTGRSSFSQG